MSGTTSDFYAIAYNISEEYRGSLEKKLKWVAEHIDKIKATIDKCAIADLIILGSGDYSNERFADITPQIESVIRNECFIFIIGETKSFYTREKVQCFYNEFFKYWGKTMEQYKSGSIIIKISITGENRRDILFRNGEITGTPAPETPAPGTDCSFYLKVMKEVEKNYYLLNNNYKLLNKELRDCKTSKRELEKEHDNILNKLDALRQEISQFKSKDPEQIRQNINKLQRELEKIQREAEEEQRQREAEEEQRQREQQRQREEEQRQREEEQRRQQQQRRPQQPPSGAKASGPQNCPSFGVEPFKCNVKSDYKKQLSIFHPDKNSGCKEEAQGKFSRVRGLCTNVLGAETPFEPDPTWEKGGSKKNKKTRKGYKKTINKRHRSKKTRR